MIKAVLFDLDGTLIDTNELILQSFRYAFEKVLNLKVDDKEITKMFGEPLKYSFKRYSEEHLEELITTYRGYNEDIHDTMCKAFPGVITMLDNLKEKGLKLGIVTSKRKVLAERGMKIAGIYDYFDVVVSPELTENHKPHKEPVEKACELLGISPKEAIMVGDSPYDLLSGKSAGAKVCAVNYTALPIERLKKEEPEYYIDEALEIIDIVEKENWHVA
ncbi:pyrophosphatase PpaX [Clostridium fallax]|uniref:Pyrophosphatase PpaX n=1 Tax=Clostridium fallax TaxID=1533 RepID=A0A1M4WVD4_9CLOT|nr:pyrophosphatase PpaX [Clostridium fallax]SHE85199.1 pyrophosphatase PpaX [Clostridium fallax]SQB07427.1 pyrophosphatase PpaX [Clostridium fallax]